MPGAYEIITADVLDGLRDLPDNSIDGLLSDVPYGFGGHQPTPEEILSYLTGAKDLNTGGDFMGKDWHVPSVAVWREVYRVLKPGAPLLSFGGSRTGSLIDMGIRMAGFEVRDWLMWVYLKGFPASLNAGLALDQAEGYRQNQQTPPVGPLAKVWSGHEQKLRPSYEPIIVARKPLDGTLANNIRNWGVGALDIGATRLEGTTAKKKIVKAEGRNKTDSKHTYGDGLNGGATVLVEGLGKWPGNVLFDADLVEYDEASPIKPYFFCAKVSKHEREYGCDALPQKSAGEATGGRKAGSAGLGNPRAGASRGDGARNHHPTLKPIELVQWLASLIKPPAQYTDATLLVPYCGSGSEVIGALRAGWPNVLGIERDPEYVAIANERIPAWCANNEQKEAA